MDLKRMFLEKKFYLAVLAAFLGITAGADWAGLPGERPLPEGTFLLMAAGGMKSQTALFLLPAAAVIPCADEYLRERRKNFLRFLLIRQGKREYCADKVLTTAASGVFVWFLAAVLSVLFFFLLFFAREEVWSWPEDLIEEYLETLGRVCLTASFLSSFGAVCALCGGNVYLAFGLPFVIFYSCVILRERYLEGFYCIDPTEWVRAEEDWGAGQNGLWLFLLLLALICILLHELLLARALEEV